MARGTGRLVFALLLAVTLPGGAPDARAQTALEGRVDRLEREMRAVQRQVFGGKGSMVEPEIDPATPPAPLPGTPATMPIADLQQRVTAMEGQVATLTGQVEESQHRLQLLEEAFNAYKRITDARLKALETGAGAGVPSGPEMSGDGAGQGPETTRPATPGPSTATRAARIAAVPRPRTADKGDDAYIYGYRLWQAKLYPEAEDQLKGFAARYPGHSRASRALNLLGTAYMDDAKPSLAAIAFYDNYRTNPNGDRAADSLLNLADALVVLKKPRDEICKVYSEIDAVYGARLSPAMREKASKGRVANQCR
ncbi:hypothetical protein [uncultured Sphingomonas sp.]|uniref:hypothetical protein n=1 Tax=uncultured Sphingomonas sp. TaxID=158754 RepID=UPI0035CA9015